MRFIQFIFCQLICVGLFQTSTIAQNQVKQAPKSKWVENIEFKRNEIVNNGPINYLLVDKQENTSSEERYSHYAIQLNTSEGVQEESSLSIVYDPKYQKLIIHEIKIHRKDVSINKTIADFQFLQRETDLQRSLYDGRISGVNELRDVRVGDILEYSYTIKGYNPLLSGSYSRELDLEFSIAIDRLHYKIISPHDLTLTYIKEAEEATITKSNGETIYQWDLINLGSNFGSSVSPSWQANYKSVILTSFNNWSEVVEWAMPLYKTSKEEKLNIKATLLNEFSFDGSEESLISAIRFVQDNIRYLGFEDGVNAYKPHRPEIILKQRFGDCKDKSLLLSTILNLMNIEARPMLVHSYNGGNIVNRPPSPNAFDHCIVQFEYDGTTYQVDPTISSEGGNVENITIPNYYFGLTIDETTQSLTSIRKNVVPLYQVDEEIILDSIGGGATYTITTTCKGEKANSQRDYFNSTNRDNIANSYEKFYSAVYPNIKIDTIFVVDTLRNKTNIFVTYEKYQISSIWEEDDKGILRFDISPTILWNYVDFAETTEKNVHYQLGNPIEYIQSTKLVFPEEWNITNSTKSIKNDYFDYFSSTNYSDKTIYFKYRYYLKKPYIEAGQVQAILEDFNKLEEDLNFEVTYDKSLIANLNGGKNYLLISILLLTLIGGTYFFFWLYNNYDSPPKYTTVFNSLGGWLVLPAIGLTIGPLLFIFNNYILFLDDGYSWGTWAALWTSEEITNGKALVIMIIIESILNCLLMLYSILVVIVLFKKRTIAPHLIIMLYIISFAYPVIDGIIANALSDTADNLLTKDNLKGFIAMCIWVPYFLRSERVKTTFTQTLHESPKALASNQEG